ncbi:hypothetical protein SPRG_14187 [Saprolegnia parasitica CBS 223.65]|uniref:C2 domain-containing protein n=1 Tax=Saprolegnia parasitica (strain CBS 223.65) TaxID=695850 RepID=A0A067BNG1_SAPPC|nr:hypothetical protein SPRG_14187 [Saprolegnia parasitica CBS 223.65]KDO20039.1 hypothetical protein SPRG_14187 [Saprolegnia parasitica CBS 223.65]|eukprot:XP_012209273.1 hypothetical protein SPRG_14187 [Saprolegnia parasitica CBS 223.65]
MATPSDGLGITRRAPRPRGLTIEIPSRNPSKIPTIKSPARASLQGGVTIEAATAAIDDVTSIALELPPGQSPKKGQVKIKSIESLHAFQSLVHLNLSGHGLVSMEGLDALVQLRSLHLARNSIKAIKLPALEHLETLDLSGNFISQLPKSLGQLPRLQMLDLSGNTLTILKQVDILAPLSNLHKVLLTANPIAQLESYRDYVVFTVPGLTSLDLATITDREREKSRKRFSGSLSLDEQLEAVDKKHYADQCGIEAQRATLEAENVLLKNELQLKSALLTNKSKEWSAATEQLLQLQQELAMVHIDKRSTHDPFRLLHLKQQQRSATATDDKASPSDNKVHQTVGAEFNREYLLQKIESLHAAEASMADETRQLEASMLALRNEIVAVDQEISTVKESLLKDQDVHRLHLAQSPAPPQSPKYYFDDGSARAGELQTQIELATAEASEIERRLVAKTKEMLQADLQYTRHAMVDKNYVLFDKEISALTHKLQRITTQKAEWADELQKLERLPKAPVLRLKELHEGYRVQPSPRHLLRDSFRQCLPDTTAGQQHPLNRMLVSEKLAVLHSLQERRFELCDLLLGHETQWEVLQEERKAIVAELHNVQHNILPFCPDSSYDCIANALSPAHKNDGPESVAPTDASSMYERLKHDVLAHVSQLLSHQPGSPHHITLANNNNASENKPVHIVLETQSNNQVTSPHKVNVTFTYQSKFQLEAGTSMPSPTFAQLNSKSQLALDENTKLLLACKKLQWAERQQGAESATRMDVDPATQRLQSRLEVTLLSATNLPCTRRLSATCDPYALLHLEHQNRDSGAWERDHPTKAFRSNTRANTLFPVWDEDFVFTPIESMSTRLVVTIMDDKKASDRHEVLGETKIELRTLWEQKRTTQYFPIALKTKSREPAHLRLRLRFLYNRVDRLRRLVDRLVLAYIERRRQLPTFMCRVHNDHERNQSAPLSPHQSAYIIPVSSPTSPPRAFGPTRGKPTRYGFPCTSPVPPLSNQWETYKEIFSARKKLSYVPPRRGDGRFDKDSIYRPSRRQSSEPAPIRKASAPPHADLRIFKQPISRPRDPSRRADRFFGLPTAPSEHYKRVYVKFNPT